MSRFPSQCSAHGVPRRCAWIFPLAALTACGPVNPDRDAGVSVRPPPGWVRTDPASVRVPGRVLAAWSGPSGSGLATYETLPIPRPDAEALAAEMANRLENLPGLRVERRGVIRVEGRPAAWVVAVGPGTGDALAPSGAGAPIDVAGRPLLPTRRTWIAIPRDAATIQVVWHAPESSAPIDPAQFLAVAPVDAASKPSS